MMLLALRCVAAGMCCHVAVSTCFFVLHLHAGDIFELAYLILRRMEECFFQSELKNSLFSENEMSVAMHVSTI